jgi:hypothetical protein
MRKIVFSFYQCGMCPTRPYTMALIAAKCKLQKTTQELALIAKKTEFVGRKANHAGKFSCWSIFYKS